MHQRRVSLVTYCPQVCQKSFILRGVRVKVFHRVEVGGDARSDALWYVTGQKTITLKTDSGDLRLIIVFSHYVYSPSLAARPSSPRLQGCETQDRQLWKWDLSVNNTYLVGSLLRSPYMFSSGMEALGSPLMLRKLARSELEKNWDEWSERYRA